MPAIRPEGPLRPALFDRLCADEAAPAARAGRESLLRDLRDLFNTTRSGGPALADSVPGYGLPAIAGRPASALSVDDLAGLLMAAVLRFEPRLAADSLRVVPEADTAGGTGPATAHAEGGALRRFRLSACLRAPTGAPVDLLTEIDLDTGHARLTEASR